jgi:hypothetical protein
LIVFSTKKHELLKIKPSFSQWEMLAVERDTVQVLADQRDAETPLTFDQVQIAVEFSGVFGRGNAKVDDSVLLRLGPFSVDQRDAEAQCNYAALLCHGDGIEMNGSLGADYFKLSVHQRDAEARCIYV